MAQRESEPELTEEERTEAFLDAAGELETDVSGWTSVEQVGAAFANWVDDADDPVFGVSVMSTSKSIPPEGEDEIPTRKGAYGGRKMTRYRTVSGYQLIAGPTRTDGGTSTIIDEWYGTPDQTPREVSYDIYLDVIRRARMYLRATSARQKRISACYDGYGPDPLPEQEAEAGERQGTLDSYSDRLGA